MQTIANTFEIYIVYKPSIENHLHQFGYVSQFEVWLPSKIKIPTGLYFHGGHFTTTWNWWSAGEAMDSSLELEIEELNFNSVLCIHLHANAPGKAMNPFPSPAQGKLCIQSERTS